MATDKLEGRALDARLHELVTGETVIWARLKAITSDHGSVPVIEWSREPNVFHWKYIDDGNGREFDGFPMPKYDDTALWRVVDGLKSKGWWPRLRPVWLDRSVNEMVGWEFELERDGGVVEALHADRKTAMVLAIVEALGDADGN